MSSERPSYRWTRRQLLIAISALVAGCRPSGLNVPTVYAPGSRQMASATSALVVRPSRQPTQLIPPDIPITEAKRLYIHSYRLNPDVSNWLLRIDGLVEHPMTLSIDNLRAMPAVETMRTLECIGNPVGGGLIGNLVWTGVEIEQLLTQVGVRGSCTHVLFEAADGYTTSVELSWIIQSGVILAYAANGEPLLPEHGYPLRILIPGLYGQKMPKWITRITFADHDKEGYWEGPIYGWSNLAAVKTNSQILSPDRQTPFADPIRIEGLAYAGKRMITKVEVSTNGVGQDARWNLATLVRSSTPLAWTQWFYDWSPPAPDDYILAVRATDEHGFTQSERANGLMAGVFPDGTDAIHAMTIRVA